MRPPTPKGQCRHCGKEVHEDSLTMHEGACDGNKYAGPIFGNDIPEIDAERHLYILLIVSSGKQYFYIGQTTDIENRVKSHRQKSATVFLPHNGRMEKCEYELVSVMKTIPFDGDKKEVRYAERKMFFDLASKIGFDMVAGGR